MKTVPLGPFLGINNRRPDFDLHVDKTGDFVVAANDVDLDNAGNFISRRAVSLLHPMSNPHSLRMVSEGVGYMVRDGIMYRVTLPAYSEFLFKALTTNDPVGWVSFGDSTYYSNGTDSGRIDATGVWYPWGLPTPASPAVSATAGDLFAGWYQIGVSWMNDATGEEGGVGPSSNFELTADGGLHVTLPAAVPGGTHVCLYVSACNGSLPMLQGVYPAGTASVDVVATNNGREAFQRFEAPLPAGDQLFVANGRLCSIRGTSIYIGLPFRPGYYLPTEGVIPFPMDVSVAVPAQNGTFVAADKTYWIPGDIGDVTDKWVDVLPYGAVKGTGFSLPATSEYGWFGMNGVVVGKPTGEVECAMSDTIVLIPPATGVSFTIDDVTSRRVVSCGWAFNLENSGVTTYSEHDFTSVSGSFATRVDGVYQMLTTRDVPGFVDLGRLQFAVENRKHLPTAYLGVASTDPMLLEVTLPSGDQYTYPARSSNENLVIQRVDAGRGLVANWLKIKILGSNFQLASVSFDPKVSERRI